VSRTRFNCSSTWPTSFGDRPAEGSSSISTRGWAISARATGQAAGQQRALALQVREHRVHRVQALAPVGLEDGHGQLQVLGDRQVGEHILGLRHEGQALEDQPVRRHARDVSTVQQHPPRRDGHQAGHGLHQRRLAGAVGAEDGDDLAGLHGQAGPAHDGQAAFVGRFQRLDVEGGGGHAQAASPR
jgi:hypothetical protein